jgi:hypothetical protein
MKGWGGGGEAGLRPRPPARITCASPRHSARRPPPQPDAWLKRLRACVLVTASRQHRRAREEVRAEHMAAGADMEGKDPAVGVG